MARKDWAYATAAVVGLGAITIFVGILARPRPVNDAYAGSKSCEGCHSKVFALLSGSRHQMMMRPAGRPGVVVADFDSHAAELPFRRDEAVWAIGGKWEQQFMGHDGDTETLLPGEWHDAVKSWDLTGWDGWERPIPLQRCHGCHTVGLDVKTGKFVEPNIGCESCHGPSSWHVETWGLGKVYSGVESEVCGQCHSRGKEPTGKYYFPVTYRPGGSIKLAHAFDFNGPSGQESSHWWGNGHARERHQEYSAWARGGHASSLKSLQASEYDGRYGEVEDDCLRCHAAQYVLAERVKPSLDEVSEGITCAVCHESHGPLDSIRADCASCHGEGASFHRPEINAKHVPCPAAANVSCIDCHMPTTAMVGGKYQLHSHTPGFVEPTALSDPQASTGCSNATCHAGVDRVLLQSRFDAHYRRPPGSISEAWTIPSGALVMPNS